MPTKLHFAINAFPLKLLFQYTKSLINIIIADQYLHCFCVPNRRSQLQRTR